MRRGFYWTVYCLVMILAFMGLREMWQAHYDANLLAIRQRVSESMTQVQNLIDAANSHVNMLRISAQSLLAPTDSVLNTISPLYHHIVEAPEIAGYCSEDDSHAHDAPRVAVSGLGDLRTVKSSAARELNMALLLDPQFSATAENIPNLARAYYTSANRFIAMYPFVSCRDFHFTDDFLARESFALGTPVQDPGRAQFWTSAYPGEVDNGLMTTTGAPVYSAGQFTGTIAIDITLETLSNYVRNPEIRQGAAFIVNDRGQILAHPTLIRPTDYQAHQIWEVFGPAKIEPLRILANDPNDAFVDHGDRVVYSSALNGAPWRYVYMSDRSALAWQAVKATRLEIIGFAMLALMIAGFESARLAGIKLRIKNTALTATQVDLQHARERAETAETAARNANQAKSIMLANASHDLRTPLNAIIGFSELILTRSFGPVPAKYAEYIGDIHASGNLLLAIVNDVLDLSKVEAGRYDMTEEAIDIGRFLATSERLISTQAERSAITLDVKVEPNLPPLRADRRAMQQVMLNLLSNAIKFTPAGGQVRVHAGRARSGGLSIAVADSGKGISQRDLQMLFTPFSRGASSSTANTQGTGLGLAIVKAMIELHGGSVEIASEPGHGTKVTLTLPPERMGPAPRPIAA